MTDTGWLVIALVAGLAFGAAWVARELWIHRRRRRGRADTDEAAP